MVGWLHRGVLAGGSQVVDRHPAASYCWHLLASTWRHPLPVYLVGRRRSSSHTGKLPHHRCRCKLHQSRTGTACIVRRQLQEAFVGIRAASTVLDGRLPFAPFAPFPPCGCCPFAACLAPRSCPFVTFAFARCGCRGRHWLPCTRGRHCGCNTHSSQKFRDVGESHRERRFRLLGSWTC